MTDLVSNPVPAEQAVDATPPMPGEDIGLDTIAEVNPSPKTPATAPISAMDQQIDDLKQEFKNMLEATEHDLLEAYEWLKKEVILMFKGRSIEFFEGDNNRLSMTRLLCYISIFPASYVVIMTKTEATLGWYLGAYVLGYVGGKAADVFGKDKPQQEITETTTRTVSKAPVDEIPAKDVQIKAAGDVNVNKMSKKK